MLNVLSFCLHLMPNGAKKMSEKGSIRLKNVPADVQRYVLEVQGKEQVKCLCKRSKEFTIYALLREHQKQSSEKK